MRLLNRVCFLHPAVGRVHALLRLEACTRDLGDNGGDTMGGVGETHPLRWHASQPQPPQPAQPPQWGRTLTLATALGAVDMRLSLSSLLPPLLKPWRLEPLAGKEKGDLLI